MGTLFSYGKWGSFKRKQRAGSLSAFTDANSDAFETAFGLASVSSITQKLKAVKAARNLKVFGKVEKKKRVVRGDQTPSNKRKAHSINYHAVS